MKRIFGLNQLVQVLWIIQQTPYSRSFTKLYKMNHYRYLDNPTLLAACAQSLQSKCSSNLQSKVHRHLAHILTQRNCGRTPDAPYSSLLVQMQPNKLWLEADNRKGLGEGESKVEPLAVQIITHFIPTCQQQSNAKNTVYAMARRERVHN